jgi:hypothetical protein
MRTGGFLLTTLVLLSGGCGAPDAQAPPPVPSTSSPASVTDPADVLRAWDGRRARAYAAGDRAALRALYLPGSAAGSRDVDLLRRYTDRSLRVVGLQTQLLTVHVQRRVPGRLVLRVTDRVTGATAVSREARIRLPASAPRARQVTLVRRDGRWVVAAVRRPAAE